MTKISEIEDRGAVVAWSPLAIYSDVVAVGTKDSGGIGFDDYGGELEIYDFHIAGSQKPVLLGKIKTTARFASIDWSPCGFEMGMIVGGMVDGTVQLWNPADIMSGDVNDGNTTIVTKHSGAVTAIAFNPHNGNLLASGSANGEVLIASLDDLNAPNVFPPAPDINDKVSGIEVTQLSWNTQVAHIVASANGNGTVVVWDLRQKKAWCELRCEASNVAVSDIAWHPTEGLQIITASSEDSHNLLKLWDLRTSTSMPLATLNDGEATLSTKGGILSCAWCPHDPGMLITCGKDNRTLLWDLYAMEPTYEVPSSNNSEAAHTPTGHLGASGFQEKRYNVQWSPHRRGVVSMCSFDRKVQLHSLIGVPNTGKKSNRTPMWLRGNSGVSCGFGGKLVKFGGEANKMVEISSVIENPGLVAASTNFESGIASGEYQEFCRLRAMSSTDEYEQQVWGFMQIIFESNARQLLLHYLGFNPEDIDQMAAGLQEGYATQGEAKESEPLVSKSDAEQVIMQALLVGNFEAAVEVCFKSGNAADALILASCGGAELWAATQAQFFARESAKRPYLSVVSAVINNHLEELVTSSDPAKWRETLAILSTYGRSEEFPVLCLGLGKRLQEIGNDPEAASLCFMCALNLDHAVQYWKALVDQTIDASGAPDLLSLHAFVEKVSIFCQAEPETKLPDEVSELFALYAKNLADQGLFAAAAAYCRGESKSCNELKSRLYYGGGKECVAAMAKNPPSFPFTLVNVGVSASARGKVQQQQQTNKASRTTKSNRPMVAAAPKPAVTALPAGWYELTDPNSGRTYYANQATGETTWTKPTPPAPVPAPKPAARAPQPQQMQGRGQYGSNGYGHQQQPASYQQQQATQAPTTSYQQPMQMQQQSHQPQQVQPSSYHHQQQMPQPQQPSYQQQMQQPHQPAATPGRVKANSVASRYGDGFVTSASHPELAQQYGNVGTSNPYTGEARPGTAVVSPMHKKPAPVSSNLNLDEIELTPEKQALTDNLLGFIKALESCQFSMADKRLFTEAQKGVNILVKKMARGMVTDDVCDKVGKLASAIQNRNFHGATSIQTQLVNSEWKLHKDWLRGTKLLIQLATKFLA
mmetsp:Transcript_10890/g.16284  ORF Transcript_10890/g.16284 Transcript_10890/m.16284 type:complete len:1098 (-) Transcript_10890:198-3491(-)|eukprot:CAMPEP_0196814684 /NCGR_PEP_ID=MMETSP1362-20130617/44848_1 /TAXON_ID=163516 /ORGANISM="Leptocylindrus danicus, Strain CCMP1856" /LENGTH=1097 /DNA_ID=CAMNT_0042191379 /DNA_START=49 /DNA_END=3342 /DNA_ORIENTATION=+